MATFQSAYMPRPIEATFGYFNPSYYTDATQRMRHRINVMNGLGYIPVIGTIVGLARIIFFSQFIPHAKHYSDNEKYFSCLQVTRGCIETLSLGLIFLVPDLIFTINRELESSMRQGFWFFASFGQFRGDNP